ncbi:hypothetical protein [Streptomyces olivoreticuli]|uniref:hypothetical protein n=1 Tax=Streptomyces olivoreticuli TaxID=68246 RepID=UPI000E273B80|nr:hypothetical protein [Streptomyces olivoreticuli]
MTTLIPTPTPHTVFSPPAEPVARDPHWAAKMARLRARTLPEQTLVICDDSAVRERLDAAKAEAARCRAVDAAAGQQDGKETRRAADAVAKAQEAFDAAALMLTFRALPRPVLDGLIKQFPPTEQQAETGDLWNPEAFPAALIAAAHVERDPSGQPVEGLTSAEAQELLDAWPISESNMLFQAAWQAQQLTRASTVELGKG